MTSSNLMSDNEQLRPYCFIPDKENQIGLEHEKNRNPYDPGQQSAFVTMARTRNDGKIMDWGKLDTPVRICLPFRLDR